MTSSVYLRLAGPLQSWAGESVTGNIVNTGKLPTPSALRGLLAGALGYQRGQWPQWLENVEFTIRVDRPVQYTDDFQTINPISVEEESFLYRIALLHGKRVSSNRIKSLSFTPGRDRSKPSIVNRTYLADSEFIVRITAEGKTEEIDAALRSPQFSTYLGRKAFPAVFPFYLGVGDSDEIYKIPTVKRKQRREQRSTMQESGAEESATVIIYQFVDDIPVAPSKTRVPVVQDRNMWLEKTAELLKRRKTLI
ncbi:type I-E CRISPR-associated protein Cas5/CasD [Rothia sp. CCM 9418]|uniref:type I-E CRISPR-associated protein Cas5/CasD n=1 Tax=Rothia sp. CCM 9418 TaxID=3402661 RepID=UPI003AE6F71B